MATHAPQPFQHRLHSALITYRVRDRCMGHFFDPFKRANERALTLKFAQMQRQTYQNH